MTNNRFEALDVARGLTLAFMMIVNNPGSWEHVYAPLLHAEFNGLTPTDLVFPFFMFIMGYSIFLSLRRSMNAPIGNVMPRVLRRTFLIIIIGIALNWISNGAFGGDWGFSHLRIPGVLQRLGLCYGIVAILALTIRNFSAQLIIALTGLYFYAVLLALGNGYVLCPENIALRVDTAVFGINHIYAEGGVPFEPEGLVSTIPSICHTLLGYICARLAHEDEHTNKRKLLLKFFAITGCLFTIVYVMGNPINKKMWSSSFVLCTVSLCALLIALIDVAIKNDKVQKASRFFTILGTNCIAIYVISDIIAIIGGVTGVGYQVYEFFTGFCPLKLASLLYALTFVLVNWCIAYVLHANKVYIKL